MKQVTRKILLNPGPATTTDSVKQAMVVEDICPREKDFGKLLDTIKEDLVKVVHGGDEYIAGLFTASGTGGLEAAITSAVPKGKKILVVDNGAYGARMASIASTYGIDVVLYKVAYGDYPDVNHIEKLLKDNNDISHIAIVHHETTTGMLNPVQEVCDISKKYGVDVIVDCMSLPMYKLQYKVRITNSCTPEKNGIPRIPIAAERSVKIQNPDLTSGIRFHVL